MSRLSQKIDQLDVVFDDPNPVANSGLVLMSTLAQRLGLERLFDGSVNAPNAGGKILTLAHTLVAGGSHIRHVDLLRSGDSGRVLGFRVAAPSTVGTFMRSFTPDDVARLDDVISEALERVWGLGAGPGDGRLVIDIDPTICEVFGTQKEGAAYGHKPGVRGYHPLVGTRADTGEMLGVRLREGASQKGHDQFVRELIERVRRAGATGEILVRFDSGFWSLSLINTLEELGVSYSMTAKSNQTIKRLISEIPDNSWVPASAYGADGEEGAEVASVAYTIRGRHGTGLSPRTVRMVVRRTRHDTEQAALFEDFDYRFFVTNRTETDLARIDREHRQHATVELAIRDLKEGEGLSHLPSGSFTANSVWLFCVALAHNLIRWATRLADPNHRGLVTAATFRTKFIAIPGRVVNLSRRHTLRLPTGWPWAKEFHHYLNQLRAIPLLV